MNEKQISHVVGARLIVNYERRAVCESGATWYCSTMQMRIGLPVGACPFIPFRPYMSSRWHVDVWSNLKLSEAAIKKSGIGEIYDSPAAFLLFRAGLRIPADYYVATQTHEFISKKPPRSNRFLSSRALDLLPSHSLTRLTIFFLGVNLLRPIARSPKLAKKKLSTSTIKLISINFGWFRGG